MGPGWLAFALIDFKRNQQWKWLGLVLADEAFCFLLSLVGGMILGTGTEYFD